jgi:hypothetical protein
MPDAIEGETNTWLGRERGQDGARKSAQSNAGQAQLAGPQDDTQYGAERLTNILNDDDTSEWEQRIGYGSR